MAEIKLETPQATAIRIDFADEAVDLPLLRNIDEKTGTANAAFVSSTELVNSLQVDFRQTQKSEWLALDYISRSIISKIERF